jgi:putative ABC transport system permease protein
LRLRGGLVVSEVALAFVLLVASGLLVRSVGKLLRIDPGFDPRNVLTANVPISQEQHADPAELNAYLASVRAAVATVPGVRETALTTALPLQGWGYGVPYAIAGRQLTDQTHRARAFFKVVSPSYFGALRIKLLSGRVLRDADKAGAPPVAVINETLARREFPGENPVGRRLLAPEVVPGKAEFGREVAWEIVGVVAGEKITGLGDDISAGLYVSTEQNPVYDVSLLLRSAVPPESLQHAVRVAIGRVNKDQALGDVRTLEDVVDQSMLANRFVGTLLATFAVMALLLAAAGLYGVLSYTAAQRTHEMAIRAALGASAGHLRWLVFRGGMRLALLGLAAGLVALLPATDVTASMLFAVTTSDPLTIGVVAGVLVGAAALASYVPASSMTKVDPAEAMKRP